MKVIAAYLHTEKVHYVFHESILAVAAYPKTWDFGTLPIGSGPLISKARNYACEIFLKDTDSDYMLWCDSDMVFTGKDVQTLLDAMDGGRRPIVGAVYYGWNSGIRRMHSTAMKLDDKGIYWSLMEDEIPEKGCKRVDAVGMGLTLIHRKVLEALKPDSERLWPFAEIIYNDRSIGEDITFCMRARQKGFRTWLCGDARAGHAKTLVLPGITE